MVEQLREQVPISDPNTAKILFETRNKINQLINEKYATLNYVNASLAATTLNLFLTDDPSSAVGGYYDMLLNETGSSSTSLTKNNVTGTGTLLWSFISPTIPDLDTLSAGLYVVSIWIEHNGTKNVTVYTKLFKRDSGGTETELLETSASDLIQKGSKTQVIVSGFLNSDVSMASTDVLVLKIYANVTGGGTDPDITIYMEGTDDSRVSIRIPSSIITDKIVNSSGSTKIYVDDNNKVHIVTAGSERVTIDKDSVLSTVRFHVKKIGILVRMENSASGHQWEWYSGGDVGNNGIGLYDRTNTAYRLAIDNDGNVGIGGLPYSGNALTLYNILPTADAKLVFKSQGGYTWTIGIDNSQSGVFKIANTADVDDPLNTNAILTIDRSVAKLIIGRVETGSWPADTAYAFFGHTTLDHSQAGNYALLQSSTGYTYINAANGKKIYFRTNNSDRLKLEYNGSHTIMTIVSEPTTTASANALIAVSPAGVFYRSTSSIKYKDNIQDINDDDTQKLLQLKPRRYYSKLDKREFHGLIADEIAEVNPEWVKYNENNEPDGIEWNSIIAVMLNVIKKMNVQIKQIQEQLNALRFRGTTPTAN